MCPQASITHLPPSFTFFGGGWKTISSLTLCSADTHVSPRQNPDCDVNARNGLGHTPLIAYLSAVRRVGPLSPARVLAAVDVLIEAGADVTACRAADGESALMLTVGFSGEVRRG